MKHTMGRTISESRSLEGVFWFSFFFLPLSPPRVPLFAAHGANLLSASCCFTKDAHSAGLPLCCGAYFPSFTEVLRAGDVTHCKYNLLLENLVNGSSTRGQAIHGLPRTKGASTSPIYPERTSNTMST